MMLRLTAIAVLALAAIYGAGLGWLFVNQRALLYPRDPARAEIAASGLRDAQELSFRTGDGESLVAWLVPPREGRPVLLFFHGNAGNFSRAFRHERFRALTEDGTGLLAVNYRGYGGSTGTPSEEGLLLDARAAYGEAIRRFGAGRLIGYGESLGTGVVVKLAAEAELSAVILEAPFTATVDVAAEIYPWVPVGLLMLDQFRSRDLIGRVRAPLLVLHGERDRVVPFAQGRALFEAANPPKRLVAFREGGHEDLPRHGSGEEIARFLADVAAGRLTGSDTLTR